MSACMSVHACTYVAARNPKGGAPLLGQGNSRPTDRKWTKAVISIGTWNYQLKLDLNKYNFVNFVAEIGFVVHFFWDLIWGTRFGEMRGQHTKDGWIHHGNGFPATSAGESCQVFDWGLWFASTTFPIERILGTPWIFTWSVGAGNKSLQVSKRSSCHSFGILWGRGKYGLHWSARENHWLNIEPAIIPAQEYKICQVLHLFDSIWLSCGPGQNILPRLEADCD